MRFRQHSAFPGWSDWQLAREHDTGHLTVIEARLDDATGDTQWLTEQLRRAWALMDELRDRIDDAGSLMDTRHVASAVEYVQCSRKTT